MQIHTKKKLEEKGVKSLSPKPIKRVQPPIIPKNGSVSKSTKKDEIVEMDRQSKSVEKLSISQVAPHPLAAKFLLPKDHPLYNSKSKDLDSRIEKIEKKIKKYDSEKDYCISSDGSPVRQKEERKSEASTSK